MSSDFLLKAFQHFWPSKPTGYYKAYVMGESGAGKTTFTHKATTYTYDVYTENHTLTATPKIVRAAKVGQDYPRPVEFEEVTIQSVEDLAVLKLTSITDPVIWMIDSAKLTNDAAILHQKALLNKLLSGFFGPPQSTPIIIVFNKSDIRNPAIRFDDLKAKLLKFPNERMMTCIDMYLNFSDQESHLYGCSHDNFIEVLKLLNL